MSRGSFRRLVVVLAATVAVAACGADAVAPLPVQPPGATRSTPAPSAISTTPATPAPTGSPSRPPPPPTSGRPVAAPPTPTRTRGTPRTTPPPTAATPACQGAVRYDLPLAETEVELLTSLCFATGAVLRIQGIGPGLVTVDRPELVSQQYEAGVVDIRFVRTGTVAVTIPKEGREHTITVVVR
ncbi:hypothetical protein [Micromonospora lupini]|uniref:Uncharacterized protein n=1 Tax=Micromonospora lupini str. Lupac 08 TaxID=1150864 RepID=I0L0Z7_9ACTN|nr:hypothetical protein [Micromonospora lupini]CCH17494.1 conserved exported hypothetical protein [Micromonospora lupini str. Lupac 08]